MEDNVVYNIINNKLKELNTDKFSGVITLTISFHAGGIRSCDIEIKTKVK